MGTVNDALTKKQQAEADLEAILEAKRILRKSKRLNVIKRQRNRRITMMLRAKRLARRS